MAENSAVYEGYIEYISPQMIAGWARRVGDELPLSLQIIWQGAILGRTIANISREDLKIAGKNDGICAYEYYYPEAIENAEGSALQVRVSGTDFYLDRTDELSARIRLKLKRSPSHNLPLDTELDEQPLPIASVSSSETTIESSLVGLKDGFLIGWARNSLRSPLRIRAIVDEISIGEVEVTGIFDESITRLDPTLVKYGFRIVVPPHLRNGLRKTVSIYDATNERLTSTGSETILFSHDLKNEGSEIAVASSQQESSAFTSSLPYVLLQKKKAVVVAWDMTHNPVGRAFLIADMLKDQYDVELVGPSFTFYGKTIWPPIAGTSLPKRTFTANDTKTLVKNSLELCKNIRCDVVFVCKPRLPSLLIGGLIRQANDCPLILDIDDHELSFTKSDAPVSYEEISEKLPSLSGYDRAPYGDLWTRYSQNLIDEADGILVSNVALRDRFGGIIIRHARNEETFNPNLYDRRRVRAEFSYTDDDRVILFVGTPRAHKGIFEIADTLERIADPRLVLCIIGSINDQRITARIRKYTNARIDTFPDQPWARLPELLTMGDCVAILQDVKHSISAFQIPAKLTDSIAMGIPTLVNLTPPLADLVHTGAIIPIDSETDLENHLRALPTSKHVRLSNSGQRQLYLSEFSYSVNRARIDLAVGLAKESRTYKFDNFEKTFRLLEKESEARLPRLIDAPPRVDRRSQISRFDKPKDMILLWKQNDSDIYGRRPDMISKYMLKSGRVRRIIHFDAPIALADLEKQAEDANGKAAHQGSFVYLNCVKRILRIADTANHIRRTFLYRNGGTPVRAFGMNVPERDAYINFVRNVLEELEVDEAPLLWVCPVVFDFQAIADIIQPSCIIADIVDDQRTFPTSSETYRQRIVSSYNNILRDADAVLCNCDPVKEAFSSQRGDIHVIPNGAEIYDSSTLWAMPDELRSIKPPIIGYSGNLRDRVDFKLIDKIAEAFPLSSIVLIGSAHGQPALDSILSKRSNVYLLGVKLYEDLQRIVRHFDVAIMPHLKTEQSDRMNPLKLYVYFSLGVPIVTSDVSNISDLSPYIEVGKDHVDFIEKLAKALSKGRELDVVSRTKLLHEISWEKRIRQIWTVLDSLPSLIRS